jgi:hypothetical protein
MKETPALHHDIEHEIEQAHLEHRELPLGYEDPHKAALEDNPEHAEKLTLAVILSALFLGTSFTGPIIFGFILATPILVQLSEKLGGANISFWSAEFLQHISLLPLSREVLLFKSVFGTGCLWDGGSISILLGET